VCGHLGFSLNKPDQRIVPMMTAFAIFMDKRGGHSWGYWADNLPIEKGLGDMSRNLSAWKFKDSKHVIAHCRWGTQGKVTESNSHPFVQGNIIGAHNGMVYNHDEMNEQYGRNFDVDSQHIFQHINDGLDLKELSGYGTIVWMNQEFPEVFNFCRFNGGVFAIAEVWDSIEDDAEFLGTVWTSTEEALKVGLAQSGFGWKIVDTKERQEYIIKDAQVFEVQGKFVNISAAQYKKYEHTGGGHSGNQSSVVPFHSGDEDSLAGVSGAGVSDESEYLDGEFVGSIWVTKAEMEAQAKEGKSTDIRVGAGTSVRTERTGEQLDLLIKSLWRGSGKYYHVGKCFGCGERQEVVKHKELRVRLCFDCCYEWEETNQESKVPTEVLRDDFIASVAQKRGVSVYEVRKGLGLVAEPPNTLVKDGKTYELLVLDGVISIGAEIKAG
jgi:hypothetical protein